MRFSVLTLALQPASVGDLDGLDRIARFAAESNISCICLTGCVQRSGPPDRQAEELSDDNAALAIQRRLAGYGQKYALEWRRSRTIAGDREEGKAILTQLPILGSCDRYVSRSDDPADEGARRAIMTRLAISPTTVIDLYAFRLCADDCLDTLLDFVEATPRILEEQQPPPPRRRGPARRRPAEEPAVTTRLVCLAGDLHADPAEATRRLRSSGYLPAGPDAGRTVMPESILIKPAIRPATVTQPLAASDARYRALAAEFEV